MVVVSSPAAQGATAPVVVKISPMAHLAVGFFALGLLALVLAKPAVFAPLLVLPVIASTIIVRYRTVADRDGVTARTLVSSTTAPWSDVDGLRFDRSSWALARRKDGSEFRLPAVTFTTLPLLAAATDGRVPNPYE
jgi:Bacterial PH domain